ncbi:hypothetical protein BC826DRAFT_1040647 [Russula brevipes]|nr:hypothetical protein BC826DRAFT_1040647 [Russula brevipes]
MGPNAADINEKDNYGRHYDHPAYAANSSRPPFQAQTASPPSQNVDPSRIHAVPQQADLKPDDRTTAPTGPVPWKEQKTRGKPTLTEHGDQILAGEASAWEPTRKP